MESNQRTVPMRQTWVLFSILATIVLVITGYSYYGTEKDKIRLERYNDIVSVAELKVKQIEKWRSERIEDARVFAEISFPRNAIIELMNPKIHGQIRNSIRKQLLIEDSLGPYTDGFIVDAAGRLLVSADIYSSIDSSERSVFYSAVKERISLMSDLFREGNGDIYIDAMAPILDGSGRTAAVVVLRSNADEFLYPMINSWPIPSRSAETLLLERKGDHVLFLNNLRHNSNAAFSLSMPLSLTSLPAAQAALGKVGMFEGKDYRGVEVLAHLRPIPNAPWFMVAKVDESEILGEAIYRGSVAALFVVLFMAVGITTMAYAYRHRQADVYRALYHAEVERKEIEEEFKATLYSIGDAVITTDANGLVKQMNHVAESLTGWTESEARGVALEKVFRTVNEETGLPLENPVLQVLKEGLIVGLANHTLLISRDGVERAIADSGAPIHDETGSVTGVVIIFRDQTKERMAETALRDSQQMLKTVLDTIPARVFWKDKNSAFLGCNLSFAKDSGFDSPDEIIGKDDSQMGWHAQAELYREDDKKVIETGIPKLDYEEPQSHQDGIRWLRTNKVPLRNATGEVVGVLGTYDDITKAKEAESLLVQEQNLLSSLMENTVDRIYFKDLKGRFTRVSANMATFCGLTSADQLIGKTDFDLFAKESAQETYEQEQEIIRTGVPMVGREIQEAWIRGSLTWASVTKVPMRNEAGKIIGIFGITRDITERKRAEEQVNQLAAIVQSSEDAIIGKTLDGIITSWNKGAENIYGYNADEVIGKNISILIPPGHPNELREILERLKAHEHIEHYETVRRRKDGREIQVSLTISPILDTQGKIRAASSVGRDITQRKNAEVALRESEEKFRSLVEGSSAAIWIHDGKRFLYANPAALELIGYTAEEFYKMTPSDIIHPDSRQIVMKRMGDRLGGKDVPKHYEYQIRKKLGDAVWIDFSGSMIEYQGQAAIIASAYDITERKKLEEQLVQAQKMEGIGRLAGGIAHDYNNMLGVIIGYGDLLINKIDKSDPAYHALELITSAAKRGADITRQLLAFARREIVSPHVLNPNEAIESLRKMLQSLIGENIKLIFLPGKDVWNIRVDKTQLDQILVNLATNARDAIDDVGVITIETSNVHIDESYTKSHMDFSPGEYVVISFSDTGKGISKEAMEKIFEPFFTTKSRGQGTGLGLSTVYGIIKQNHGGINVYSEINAGTTLKIYLPRHEAEAEEPESPVQIDQSVTGDETVLIVEDQADLLELAKNSLEKYGYKVLTALSPGEGILLCENHEGEIHLLLTDVIMPTMNGKELRNKIQAMKPHIKTIFMSGYTANVIAHKGVLEQGVEFIQKPFIPFALAKKVNEVLKA